MTTTTARLASFSIAPQHLPVAGPDADPVAETVTRLADAIECGSGTAGAQEARMASFCALIAQRAGLPAPRCAEIGVAARLHDIGMIGVPECVRRKPGRYDQADRRSMQRHTRIGYGFLAGSPYRMLQVAATIALSHHERVDGSGYPCGAAGDDIPVEGRIAAVADTFNALLIARTYKPAWPVERAVAHLRARRGSDFDGDLVDVFVDALDTVPLLVSASSSPPGPPRTGG